MRTANVVVRPTERGLLVCACDFLGTRQYGTVGEIIDTAMMTHLARRAAEQGARLVLEVQPDGQLSFLGGQ